MGLSKYVMEAKVYHQTRCFWLVIEPPLWKRSISQWIGIIISSGVENSFPKQLHKAWHRLLCVVLHDVALRCVNILLVSKVLSKNIHNSSWVQSWREIAGKPKTKTPVDCKMPILWPSKKRKKYIVSLIQKKTEFPVEFPSSHDLHPQRELCSRIISAACPEVGLASNGLIWGNNVKELVEKWR